MSRTISGPGANALVAVIAEDEVGAAATTGPGWTRPLANHARSLIAIAAEQPVIAANGAAGAIF
jgi:hypothetical protein